MRADHRAEVALDAVFRDPGRNVNCNAALLVSSGALRGGAACILFKGGNRQILTVEGVNRDNHVVYIVHELRTVAGCNVLRGIVHSVLPGSRNINLHVAVSAAFNSVMVHLNDGVTLLGVGLRSRILHVADCVFLRDDLRDGEECGLENRVDSGAKADLLTDLEAVDRVEVHIVISNVFLNLARELLVKLFRRPLAVQQEAAALLQVFDHVIGAKVSRVVTCNKVSLGDVIGGLDRRMTESQVGHCQTAGLLGVVVKVTLCVHIGVVADDLDGVLVCADGTVRTEAPELAGLRACRCGIRVLVCFEGQVRNIVHDADGELLLRIVALFHVAVNSDDVSRLRILGAEAVTTGENLSTAELRAVDSSQNVKVQRLADGARLLRSVEHGDGLNGFRKHVKQVLCNERSVKVNLNKANLLAGCYEVIDNLFDGLTDRAHSDDDLLRIRSAIVVEGLVIGADLLVDLVHVIDNGLRNRIVVLVASLTSLEEDIAVLCLAAENRVLRIQSVSSELVYGIPVEHLAEILVVPYFDLLNLMRGTEAVEEVQERNLAVDSGKVSHSAEVHNFLRAVGAQHCITGLAACIDVGMVTEDVQSVGSNAASRNVDNARQQLAGHLVHVRDHQEQALRSGVGGGKSTSRQRTVNCTSSAGLRLHLRYAYFTAEKILSAGSSILIGLISHNGRRRDRIDRSNVGKRIRNMRGGVVAIHGLHFSCHLTNSSFKDYQWIYLTAHYPVHRPAVCRTLP